MRFFLPIILFVLCHLATGVFATEVSSRLQTAICAGENGGVQYQLSARLYKNATGQKVCSIDFCYRQKGEDVWESAQFENKIQQTPSGQLSLLGTTADQEKNVCFAAKIVSVDPENKLGIAPGSYLFCSVATGQPGRAENHRGVCDYADLVESFGWTKAQSVQILLVSPTPL